MENTQAVGRFPVAFWGPWTMEKAKVSIGSFHACRSRNCANQIESQESSAMILHFLLAVSMLAAQQGQIRDVATCLQPQLDSLLPPAPPLQMRSMQGHSGPNSHGSQQQGLSWCCWCSAGDHTAFCWSPDCLGHQEHFAHFRPRVLVSDTTLRCSCMRSSA